MKNKLFFILLLVPIFLLGVIGAYAQAVNCGPTQFGCVGASTCANSECIISYNTCDSTASAQCSGQDANCNQAYTACASSCSAADGSCLPACESEKKACLASTEAAYASAVGTCQAEAKGLQQTITQSGMYGSGVGCVEMSSCLDQVPVGKFQSFDRLNCDGIQQNTYEKIIDEYGATHKAQLESNLPLENTEVQQALINKGYEFETPSKLAEFIDKCANCDLNALSEYSAKQSATALSNDGVRAAMAGKQISLPWWKQTLVTYKVLANNPYVKAGSILVSVGSLGYKAYTFFTEEDEQQQVTYNQNNYYGAQADISNAQNSQAVGASQWTNCPGHRDEKCSGQAVCVNDNKDGASQCVASLPSGQRMDVTFGSIHVIDNEQNNMFTLTGSENQGVVYQQDGFVDIDRRGATKISVAGQGALVTDVNKNQLYLGRGTTTYFGTGNLDSGFYLTNTFVLDIDSKVAVDAVNEFEQNLLKENGLKSLKKNPELTLTLDRYDLKPYKNAVDIGNFKDYYQVLTRGFSNIILVEKNMIFPIMTRDFAKGDSLIVKNKDVKIQNIYSLNDGAYEYTIKTFGDSTKVLTKNKKVIQDSGSFDHKLTNAQSLLIYNT